MPVSIRVSFIPQVALPAGSLITVTLDQFGGPSARNIMIFSSPEGAITLGAWNATSSKFSVMTDKQLLASEGVSFMVRSTYGILLPPAGLTSNQSSLTMEVVSNIMNISQFSIRASPAINSSTSLLTVSTRNVLFAKLPMLLFAGSAGQSASMTLNIFLNMPLSTNDLFILYLPGFSGIDFSGFSLLDSAGNMFTASLNTKCSPAVLLLVADRNISVATTSIEVRLPSSAGLILPERGVLFDANISLVYKLRSVKCTFNPIGSLIQSAVRFSPERAGHLTKLVLTVRPTMNIRIFDSFHLSLPNFVGGKPGTMFVGANFVGEWTGLYPNASLTLVFNEILAAKDHDLTFEIGTKIGLKLPQIGVRVDSDLFLDIIASDGSYSGLVMYVQPVGSLKFLNFSYAGTDVQPAKAGKVAKLLFTFVPYMSLKPGDFLLIELPEFFDMEECVELNVGPVFHLDPGLVYSSWSREMQILNISVSHEFGGQSLVSIAVDNICFPRNGIRSNGNNYTLTIMARDGPVPVSAFPNVQPIGHFDSTLIDFGNPVSGLPVRLGIEFIPRMELQPGECVSLHLPGFRVFGSVSTLQVDGFHSFSSAAWDAESERLSLFIANISIDIGTAVRLELATTAGIMLPAEGIRSNQTSLTIATIATDGPVFDTAFSTVQPVGSFVCSSLKFSSDIAGSETDILLILIARMDFVAGDLLSLELPSFLGSDKYDLNLTVLWSRGENCELFVYNHSNQLFFPAEWVSNELRLQVSGNIPAFTSILVNISGVGIVLPDIGIQANQSDLTLSTNALSGPLKLSPIASTPYIGSVLRTPRVSYLPVTFNETTTLIFSFQSYMDIAVGDIIYLYLPNFAASGTVYVNTTINFYSMKNVSVVRNMVLYQNVTRVFNNSVVVDSTSCKIVANQTTEERRFETIQNTTELMLMAGILSAPLQLAEWKSTDSGVLIVGIRVRTPINVFDRDNALKHRDIQPVVTIKIENIRLPTTGLAANQQNVMLEIKSSSGLSRLGKMQIPLFSAVGSFLNMSLDFAPRKTGESVDILLFLHPTMDILRGETVSLKLPNFMGPSVIISDASAFDSDQTIKRVEWNQSTYELTLILARDIIGGFEVLDIVIPGSQLGVELPVSGLLPNQPGMYVSCNAQAGPVQGMYGVKTPSIGSFLSSEIRFDPPSAGAYVIIALNFSARMRIMAGDVIQLALKATCNEWCCGSRACSFQSDGAKELNISAFVSPGRIFNPIGCGSSVSQVLAVWNPILSIVGLHFSSYISEGCQVLVVIPSRMGIRTPLRGLEADPSSGLVKTITISARAVAGNVLPTVVARSWPIGSFLSTSSLLFDPPKVKEIVAINVSFSPVMNISQGDLVEFYLPGFSGKSQYNSIALTENGQFLSVLWVLAEQTLQIKVINGSIGPNSNFSVRIPLDFGIMLPSRGLAENQATLTMRTNARAGPVQDVPVFRIPAIGSFMDSATLSFDQPRANRAPRSIMIKFDHSFNLADGDVIVVDLPNFQSRVKNITVLVDTIPINLNSPQTLGSWNEATSSLSFNCCPLVSIASYSAVWIQILCSSWTNDYGALSSADCLILPPLGLGLTLNQQAPKISTNARAGLVLPTSFNWTQTVGVFSNLTLLFRPPAAGTLTVITLSLMAHMPMRQGDTLVLTLPGFEGNISDKNGQKVGEVINFFCKQWNTTTLVYSSQICMNGFWTGGDQSIFMTVKRAIELKNRIEVDIPSTLGVRLPIEGIRLVQEDPIRIETDAPSGPVLPTIITGIVPVGAFLVGSTSAQFQPPKVGENVSLSIALTAAIELAVNDSIVLDLPGFHLPKKLVHQVRNFSVTVDCQCDVWDTECQCSNQVASCSSTCDSRKTGSRLVFTSTVDIPARQPINLVLNSSLGIRLPSEGLSSTCCILLSAHAKNGDIFPSRVSHVQPVGSFNNSAALDFMPPRLGTPVDLIVSFSPTMPILYGENVMLELPSLDAVAEIEGSDQTNQRSVIVIGYVGGTNVSYDPQASLQITGLWNLTTHRLTLSAPTPKNMPSSNISIPASSACTFRITGSTGPIFVLPIAGLQANFVGFTISTDARQGPVMPSAILSSPGIYLIGNFTWSRLSYSNEAVAGKNTSIVLGLVPIMTIYPGDVVHLLLPYFTCTSVYSPLTLEAWKLMPYNCSENNALLLSFEASSKVSALVLSNITIPGSLGVALPKFGVIANDNSIQIRADCIAGPVNFTAVLSSPAVGSLEAISVLFPISAGELPQAGEVTALSVTFLSYSQIDNNTLIKLYLQGFGGSNLSNVSVSNVFFGLASTSVSPSGATLLVPCVGRIPSNTSVNLLFTSEAAIRLPSNGVRANQSSIQISHDALSGAVAPQSFAFVQAVGALQKSSALFLPGLAGVVASIVLSFVPQMPMMESDTISIHLPRFRDFDLSQNESQQNIGVTTEVVKCPSLLSLGTVAAAVRAMCRVHKIYNSSNISIYNPSNSSLFQEVSAICSAGPLESTVPLEDMYTSINNFMQAIKKSNISSTFWAVPGWSDGLVDSLVNKVAEAAKGGTGASTYLRLISADLSVANNNFSSRIFGTLQELSGTKNLSTSNRSAVNENPSSVFEGLRIIFNLRELRGSILMPGVRVNISIPVSAKIQTPSNGVRTNEQVMLSTDALLGPVPLSLVEYIQPIGVMSTQLSFSLAARAGASTLISLRLMAAMTLRPGDSITIALPGFSSCLRYDITCPNFTVVDESRAILNTSPASNSSVLFVWSQYLRTLTLMVRSDIPASIYVDAMLPQQVVCVESASSQRNNCSLLLPREGVTSSSNILVSADVVNGPVAPSPPILQYVGAFEWSSIDFDFANAGFAGALSPMTLAFKPLMDIVACERVLVHLPMFSYAGWAPWIQAKWIVSGRGNWSSSAYWNGSTSILVFDVVKDVKANDICTVMIGRSEGLQLPVAGVRVNQSSIQIGAEARAGSVTLTSVGKVQSIGAFSFGPQVKFNLPGMGYAGEIPNSLSFVFRARMVLNRDDEVGLIFPGCSVEVPTDGTGATAPRTVCADGQFDGPLQSRDVALQETDFVSSFTAKCLLGSLPEQVSHASETVASVRLTATRRISADTLIFVTLPSSCGIRLPRNGLQGGEPLEFYVIAVEGSINRIRVTSFPLVGAFAETSITFSPVCAGEGSGGTSNSSTVVQDGGRNTSLALRFAYQSDLLPGEWIVLKLPGFGIAPGGFVPSAVTVSLESAGLMSAAILSAWSPAASTLRFSFNTTVPRRATVALSVSAAAGIVLPTGGVSKNQQTILLSTANPTGPVSPTPLLAVEPVGSILDSAIVFDTLCPGHLASITITFRATMALGEGDRILLRLPGFAGATMGWALFAGRGLLWNVSWDPEASLLVATFVQSTKDVPSGAPMLIGPVNPGVVLPTKATPANGSAFTISARSGSGDACWVPLGSSPSINCTLPPAPPIVSESSLNFEPAQAGVAVNITLALTLGLGLRAGGNVSLRLPGFEGPTYSQSGRSVWIPVQSQEPSGLFDASWWAAEASQSGGTIVLMATRASGPVRVRLFLAHTAGIALPRLGLTGNQSDLVLQVEAAECLPLYFDCTRVLGAVYSAPVQRTPAVGAFLHASLRLSPQIPGQRANITFAFALSADLRVGESVEVLLPGFGRAGSFAFVLYATGGSALNVTRTAEPGGLLVLTAIKLPLPRNTTVVVEINAERGVALPADGVAPERLLIRASAADGPVPWTVLLDAPQVVAYRCFMATAVVKGNTALCRGNRTVRVCARSQLDAGAYAATLASGPLREMTLLSCQRGGARAASCATLDGNATVAAAAECCAMYGVEEAAGCLTDGDCIGVDSRTPPALSPTPTMVNQATAVPLLDQQCCDYCSGAFLYTACVGVNISADAACQKLKCSGATPCYGRALYSVRRVIDPKVGGIVRTALGAGISVPPGVWPANVTAPATVEASALPAVSRNQILALLSRSRALRAGEAAMVQVTMILTLGPSGTVFAAPGVTLEFPVDAPLVAFGLAAGLRLGSFRRVNDGAGSWVMQPHTPQVDENASTVFVSTMSFSEYAVFLLPPEPASQPPASNTSYAAVSPTPLPTAAPALAPSTEPATSPPPLLQPGEAGISIMLVAGVAGAAVVVIFVAGGLTFWLMRRRQAYKYKGLMATPCDNPLLAPTKVDLSIPSTVGRNVARPMLAETASNVVVQSDFIMADGATPAWDDNTSEVRN